MPLIVEESPKNFLNLGVGESATIVFVDDPRSDEFVNTKVHFFNNRYYECSGSDCKLCEKGINAVPRYYAEIFNVEEGSNQIMIIPISLARILKTEFEELQEEGYDPTEIVFKIRRIDRTQWNARPIQKKKPKFEKKFKVQREYNRNLPKYTGEEVFKNNENDDEPPAFSAFAE